MSFLRKEPGVAFAAIFVIMGLTFVAVVSLGERVSPVAGNSFNDGLLNGAAWQPVKFPARPYD